MLVWLGGNTSMEEKIVLIINKMADYLNISQMKKLQEVLLQTFSENKISKEETSNNDYLDRKSVV